MLERAQHERCVAVDAGDLAVGPLGTGETVPGRYCGKHVITVGETLVVLLLRGM